MDNSKTPQDLTGGKSFIAWLFSKERGGRVHFIVANIFAILGMIRVYYSEFVEHSFDQKWMFPVMFGFLAFIILAYWGGLFVKYRQLKKYS